MSSSLPGTAPIVIVGGGIVGTSVLYHLALRGVLATLVERKKIASGTTWHAAGIVGQLRDSTAQTELGKYTARLFKTLEVETGQGTGYRQSGTINLALSNLRHEQLLRTLDHAARMGIESFLLNKDELKERWPLIVTDDVKSALHVPSNGQVNPFDVTVALSKGARTLGAKMFEDTTVTRLKTNKGKVTAVETDKGTIATAQVLLACGMWSHSFAKAHGIVVPLHAAEHFYIVTEPFKNLPRDLPILNIVEERTYWKEDAGKLLIGGFEEMGKPWESEGIPAEFEFDELPFDIEHVEPELERMFKRMPALAEVGIQTFFNGPESFTPDGRPYLGPTAEVEGLFLATGMNSNGILNSGGVGLTMAEWMIDGRPSRSMGPLSALRAHPFQSNTLYNRTRSAESVGFHYGLHWPGRQVTTARGIRRVPLHRYLKCAGAVFAERIGWEIPMYYDRHGKGWTQNASIRWKDWSPFVRDECLAARNAAVLLDQSMYAKYVVKGPDAAHALNRICGAQTDVDVGTSTYTQFLNEKGGIEADVTIMRTGQERFLIVSGHPSQIRDQYWIKAHADQDWRFEVFDATSGYAFLSIHGPKARQILSAITADDVSAASFPFGTAKEIDLAFARGLAIRRSFLGEVGFELLIPTEFSYGVYEKLIEAGSPLGLRHMGMFAMNSCRLEKGFRHFGHDIGEDDTPFECGLGFAVDLDKTDDFCGKQALSNQRASTAVTRHQMVSIAVDGLSATDGPWLMHNEPVWKGDRIVGHVTSGDWGFRLERMIGLATLHNPDGVRKEWIAEGGFKVQIAGELFNITAQLAPLYDPSGKIMRS